MRFFSPTSAVPAVILFSAPLSSSSHCLSVPPSARLAPVAPASVSIRLLVFALVDAERMALSPRPSIPREKLLSFFSPPLSGSPLAEPPLSTPLSLLHRRFCLYISRAHFAPRDISSGFIREINYGSQRLDYPARFLDPPTSANELVPPPV